MKSLTQYGRMAERHWREHCPKMVRALEAQGQLHAMLLEAEEKTKDEMYDLTTRLMAQGLTAQQAHDQAWEQGLFFFGWKWLEVRAKRFC